MKTILKVNNLDFSFSATSDNFFNNLNFEIYENEKIVIYGQNGSGKSTLCKLLVGLYLPKKGNISYQIDSNNKVLNASMVFQTPDHNLVGKTVEEELAFSLENLNISYEEMHKKMTSITKEFNLEDLLMRDIKTLSGGMKQKLAIASSIISDPFIVIFDEVTSQLDNLEKKHVNHIIDHLQHQLKKTVILVSHNLEDLKNATRVCYINNKHAISFFKPFEFLKKIFKENDLSEIEIPGLVKFNHEMNFVLDKTLDETINEILNLWIK